MCRADLAVRAERAGFAYSDAVNVFTEVSFVLQRGWTGLVGENGAGKSTLLELIAGQLYVSEGDLRVEPSSARVVSCPQRVDQRTPEQDALAHANDAAAHKLRGKLQLSQEGYARFDSMSPGERKRWQIAAALYAEPEVLLLDEPTNHLDAQARAFLAAVLREFRGIGLLVSHDRARLHGGSIEVSCTSRRWRRPDLRPTEAAPGKRAGRGGRVTLRYARGRKCSIARASAGDATVRPARSAQRASASMSGPLPEARSPFGR